MPGEDTDHVHHRSFWVAHGLVNGVDFWTEAEGHGFQVHGGFEAVHSGPAFGRIVQRVSWRKDDPAAGTPLLEERRTLTFWNTPASARLLDVTVAFHAAHGAVTFGDTKEGGLCSLRVPEAIKGTRGGVISNAYGGIHEAENWGQRAPWVDYSGDLNDADGTRRTVGVAIFDHPRNPHYPIPLARARLRTVLGQSIRAGRLPERLPAARRLDPGRGRTGHVPLPGTVARRRRRRGAGRRTVSGLGDAAGRHGRRLIIEAAPRRAVTP